MTDKCRRSPQKREKSSANAQDLKDYATFLKNHKADLIETQYNPTELEFIIDPLSQKKKWRTNGNFEKFQKESLESIKQRGREFEKNAKKIQSEVKFLQFELDKFKLS